MARWRRKQSNSSIDSSVTWTAYYHPELAEAQGAVPQGAAEVFEQMRRRKPEEKKKRREKVDEERRDNSQGRHVQSPTPFEKQTARPGIADHLPDVNENRFNSLPNGPRIFSKTKKVPTPNLAKLIPRMNNCTARQWDAAEYKPNFGVVWKNRSHDFYFEKTVGRKSAIDASPSPEYHDVSYTQVRSKVPGPDLRRAVARSISPQFPIHMQCVVSWQALHSINEKTLEMNAAYRPPPKVLKSHFRTASQ